MKIGFIGTGIMGHGMIRNLMKAGHTVYIYNRTREKAEDLVAEGAVWTESAAECTGAGEAVITIVGFPRDVEEVYFGERGIFSGAKPGTVLIDMTTTSPRLSVRIYEEAKRRGLDALDAPVSGGNTGAEAGTLAIMAGGDREVFDRMLPLLQAMGTNIVYEGPAGYGQHTKMANQIAIAGALAGVCEALSYAKRVGLDQQKMYDTIRSGAAGSWQMDFIAPKVIAGDYSAAFYLQHLVKDLGIADEEMSERGMNLDVLYHIYTVALGLEEEGHGNEGTQVFYRYYEKQ